MQNIGELIQYIYPASTTTTIETMENSNTLPKDMMKSIADIEALAEELMTCRQEVISMDRRRNNLRMAMR